MTTRDAASAIVEWKEEERRLMNERREQAAKRTVDRLISVFPDQPAMMRTLEESLYSERRRVIELLPDNVSLVLAAGMTESGG